jgi:rhamnulokinase
MVQPTMANNKETFLVVDLGAENGRINAVHFSDNLLAVEELHRFTNQPVQVQNSIHWDILNLWRNIKDGLTLAASQYGSNISGLGLDTWGVDFGLLASDDTLLGNPYHYRDPRTDNIMDAVFQKVTREEIFEHTGIQFLQLNSLYQLYSMLASNSAILKAAKTFLTMPDIFNFWLSGEKNVEYTNATTTQCYDTRSGDWAREMLQDLGLPVEIFSTVISPGTVLGQIRSEVANETNLQQVPIIAPATHDTGSAVAAVPMSGEDAIFLSSGTWSLMGVEVKHPIINEQSLAYNFTNEGGVQNTFRFLKNLMGLWLVQECRRSWFGAEGKNYSYQDLTQLASRAAPLGTVIIPSDKRFLRPADMPHEISLFCKETGQLLPDSKGAIIRCILESLALEYRWVAQRLSELTTMSLKKIHIIGGGSQNQLLNQFTADATGCMVISGPVEATTVGNAVVQAMAMKRINSLAEGRELVKRSFPIKIFEPKEDDCWDKGYQKYLMLST